MSKFRFVIVLFLVLSFGAVVFFNACSPDTVAEEPAASKDQGGEDVEDLTILYKGKETVISMEELMQLDEIVRDVTPVPKDDEEKATRNVKGVLLEDVFQEYLGISQADPGAILLLAGDGYSIEVSGELLDTREIILAYEIDGKPLEGWEKPLRSVVPDVFEMYWVKNLTGIEIIESREEVQVSRIIMMDTRISDIPGRDYEYYDNSDRAVKISDMLFNFNEDDIQDTVFIRGIDSLEKNEKVDNFRGAYIKYTGQDSPMFLSEDLPKGMWVKEILYFIYGGSAYFSAASGFKALQVQPVEKGDAIGLAEVISVCGLEQTDSYLLKAIDDYSIEIDSDSIELGYIYLQENGLPAVYFEGMPENTDVKDLIYIGVSE